MHDIICPHCGESFIARDVAFNLSDFVLPLLSGSDASYDAKELKFKFFADEEHIITNHDGPETEQLECDSPMGPGINDTYYTYSISNKTLWQYILDRSNVSEESLDTALAEFSKSKSASVDVSSALTVSAVCTNLFESINDEEEEFDPRSPNVQAIISALRYVRGNPNKSVKLYVRLYCNSQNGSKNKVGNKLFVKGLGSIHQTNRQKCCRFCGFLFPDEFGFYKMKPVVLLGSHYSGKTSYLLSLLHTVRNKPPFIGDRGLSARTLSHDKDLEAFTKNIESYAKGEPPVKTDFTNVPILNLMIRDTIYSFIDWPGEKFISHQSMNNSEFAFQTRPIIGKAVHFLCFLEPSQVLGNYDTTEENVRFEMYDLAAAFTQHMQLSPRLKSFSFVLNKFDIIASSASATHVTLQELARLFEESSEWDVYQDGRWLDDNFKKINNSTRDYLINQVDTLISGILPSFPGKSVSYIPVSPYGRSYDKVKEENASSLMLFGKMAGLPLLHILKVDRKL